MSSFTIGVVKTFDNDPICKIYGSYSHWLAPNPTSISKHFACFTLRILIRTFESARDFLQRIIIRHIGSWTYRPPVPASSSQFRKTRINQFSIRNSSPTDRNIRGKSAHGNTLYPPNSWVIVYIVNTNRTPDLGRKETRARSLRVRRVRYTALRLCVQALRETIPQLPQIGPDIPQVYLGHHSSNDSPTPRGMPEREVSMARINARKSIPRSENTPTSMFVRHSGPPTPPIRTMTTRCTLFASSWPFAACSNNKPQTYGTRIPLWC